MSTQDHIQETIKGFQHRFGRSPDHLLRVPGRVNIIGEHTDYSLLPVLPITIDREVVFAVSAIERPLVEVRSLSIPPDAFIDRHILSRTPEAPWHGYLFGALKHLQEARPELGAQMVIGGDLPSTGGLSSSTALTMGAIAALSLTWGVRLSRDEIVARDVQAEREVGVESGAMDQIAITFGRKGHALRIDFSPPNRKYIKIPDGLAFVVAYSGTHAPKNSAMRTRYNDRVIGCRLAAAILVHEAGIKTATAPVLANTTGLTGLDRLVAQLPEKASGNEVARRIHGDAHQLVRLSAAKFDPSRVVPVRNYAIHVLSEARRVDAVESALLREDFAEVGENLDRSQDSLRDLYGCSTRALDELCAAMRSAGAYGARLTGAGFGGYALAVLPADRVGAVTEAAIAATGGPAFKVQPSDGFSEL